MTQNKKYSLLIVDDDSSNIRTLTHILHNDYTIFVAKSGQNAITVAEKHIPDVILLDVIMPEMNGYEVLEVLKKSDITKHIPVIFITGLSDSADEEMGFELDIVDYIPKPFAPSIVKLRVRNQIKLIEQFRAYEYDIMKYKLANEALQIALWDMDITDSESITTESSFTWSQEFRNMLGFTDENDFPNKLSTWSDSLHPDDKEKTLKALMAHIEDPSGKTLYNPKYRLMCKNGEYRYFQALGSTLRDPHGNPLRVAGALMIVNS